MSVIEWFDYTLALVLLLYSLWLHRKAQLVIQNAEIMVKSGSEFLGGSLPAIKTTIADLSNIKDQYLSYGEELKQKLDKQLEISFGEHMFVAGMNMMISLGASDMSKEEKAKQTMALIGFQNIGRHIAMGIKHEIPAVEMLNQYSENADQGSQGGLFAPETIISKVTGMDIPPGTFQALNANAKAKAGSAGSQQTSLDWKY